MVFHNETNYVERLLEVELSTLPLAYSTDTVQQDRKKVGWKAKHYVFYWILLYYEYYYCSLKGDCENEKSQCYPWHTQPGWKLHPSNVHSISTYHFINLVLYLASFLIKQELTRHLFLHLSNASESPHQNWWRYLDFVYQHNENQMRHEVNFLIPKIKLSTLMSKTI